jgi:hypothetical protein
VTATRDFSELSENHMAFSEISEIREIRANHARIWVMGKYRPPLLLREHHTWVTIHYLSFILSFTCIIVNAP